MHWPKFLAALAGASLLSVQPVFAHGFAGPHMFISTLLIDDPNVADEASLPTFSFLPQPTEGGVSPGLYSAGFRVRQTHHREFRLLARRRLPVAAHAGREDRQRLAEPGSGAEVQALRQPGA